VFAGPAVANIDDCRIVGARWGNALGVLMRRLVVIAALCAAAVAQQSAGAAERARKDCYTQNAIEAEQAIRFLTDVMIVSTTCQDTVYAEFRLRNRDPILAYQKAMIAHFHGNSGFDRWNTVLANEAAQKRAGTPSTIVCQQSADLLKQAGALDPPKFRAFAASQAATAGPSYPKCGK
jgi:hypothetical protein